MQDGKLSSALFDKTRALKYQYGGLVFCHSYFVTGRKGREMSYGAAGWFGQLFQHHA